MVETARPLQGVWVHTPDGELGSHVLSGVVKKVEKEYEGVEVPVVPTVILMEQQSL